MLLGDVAARHRAACVMCAVHTTHTPLCDMFPHHQITYNDVILSSFFKHKYNFSHVQYKLPDDGRRPKYVEAVFVCILI